MNIVTITANIINLWDVFNDDAFSCEFVFFLLKCRCLEIIDESSRQTSSSLILRRDYKVNTVWTSTTLQRNLSLPPIPDAQIQNYFSAASNSK